MINYKCSAYAVGRLQAEGIRPRPDRARLARMDVVSGGQATKRGCTAQDWTENLGATGPQAQPDGKQGGL